MAIVNLKELKPLQELTVKHIQVIEEFEELLEQGISGLTMSDIAATLKVSLRGGPWICSKFDIESFPQMPHDDVMIDFLTCSLGSKATPGVKWTVMESSIASTPTMSAIESMMPSECRNPRTNCSS